MFKEFNDRKFQFWHYRVSHGELLVRSPKGINESKNIDVIFQGVEYVELPRFLPKMVVGKSNNTDLHYISSKLDKSIDLSKVFVLLSEQKRFYVVASIMKIDENEFDMFELPFTEA